MPRKPARMEYFNIHSQDDEAAASTAKKIIKQYILVPIFMILRPPALGQHDPYRFGQ
jgi:hypothetical protein